MDGLLSQPAGLLRLLELLLLRLLELRMLVLRLLRLWLLLPCPGIAGLLWLPVLRLLWLLLSRPGGLLPGLRINNRSAPGTELCIVIQLFPAILTIHGFPQS